MLLDLVWFQWQTIIKFLAPCAFRNKLAYYPCLTFPFEVFFFLHIVSHYSFLSLQAHPHVPTSPPPPPPREADVGPQSSFFLLQVSYSTSEISIFSGTSIAQRRFKVPLSVWTLEWPELKKLFVQIRVCLK